MGNEASEPYNYRANALYEAKLKGVVAEYRASNYIKDVLAMLFYIRHNTQWSGRNIWVAAVPRTESKGDAMRLHNTLLESQNVTLRASAQSHHVLNRWLNVENVVVRAVSALEEKWQHNQTPAALNEFADGMYVLELALVQLVGADDLSRFVRQLPADCRQPPINTALDAARAMVELMKKGATPSASFVTMVNDATLNWVLGDYVPAAQDAIALQRELDALPNDSARSVVLWKMLLTPRAGKRSDEQLVIGDIVEAIVSFESPDYFAALQLACADIRRMEQELAAQ